MELQKKVDLLQKAFPELPPALLAELAGKVRECTYPMGTVLCTEEKVEDTFYIICSGKVAISKFLDGETSRILAYQGPGEFFGELALVQDSQRVATVVTTEETSVFELSKQDFLEFLESSPTMVSTIMRAVASRLRDADQRSIVELRRKNRELGLAYRGLETETQQRSKLLTTIAHQLRTPLATVKGSLTDSELDVEAVADNIDAVIQLVNNILFLQELELIEPQFRPIDISDIVRQAVDNILPSAKRAGLSVHVDMPAGLRPVTGDPSGLKQAVTALLENAVKFSPNGGEIQIRVQPHNHAVEIAVRDPGVGIPPDELEHLFDRLQPQEVAGYLFGGSGLGLPIAKAVVEQHNGSIHVTSTEGQGSCFTIYLPVSLV